jgi:sulfur-oxidizing protein SoxY
MNRRNFLGLSLGVAAVSMVPVTLSAEDFRASKPKVWTATKVDEAMKAVFSFLS